MTMKTIAGILMGSLMAATALTPVLTRSRVLGRLDELNRHLVVARRSARAFQGSQRRAALVGSLVQCVDRKTHTKWASSRVDGASPYPGGELAMSSEKLKASIWSPTTSQ